MGNTDLTDLYRLLLGVLGVWRITHLFQAEDGPWDVVVRIRRAAGDGFFGQLLDCFYCLSLWVAAPLAWVIGRMPMERFLLWLAFSGGAILLERSTSIATPEPILQAHYEEDREDTFHGMLRTNAGAGVGERESG
jgi:hypothetical protein